MARPRQVTDEQILEATRACLLELGPAVAVTEIADRLGVTHGVLFQRFGTKDELVKAALTPGEPAWIDALAGGPVGGPLGAQLLALAHRIYDEFERVVPRVALLRALGVTFKDCGTPVRAHRELSSWIARATAQGLARACEPDHVAYMLLGALQAPPFIAHLGGRKPADRNAYVQTVVELVSRSLEPEERR